MCRRGGHSRGEVQETAVLMGSEVKTANKAEGLEITA